MSEGLGEKSNSDFSGQGVLLWNTVLLPSILLEKKKKSAHLPTHLGGGLAPEDQEFRVILS